MRNFFAAALLCVLAVPALARNRGQWAGESNEVRAWFQSLTAPDTGISCCAEADAYVVDHYETISDLAYRVWLQDGRVFDVPTGKVQFRHGNPTGYDILFAASDLPGATVYCLVLGPQT